MSEWTINGTRTNTDIFDVFTSKKEAEACAEVMTEDLKGRTIHTARYWVVTKKALRSSGWQQLRLDQQQSDK